LFLVIRALAIWIGANRVLCTGTIALVFLLLLLKIASAFHV
jgi:hypothetical protein